MSRTNRPLLSPPLTTWPRCFLLTLLVLALTPGQMRGEAMLQLFNVGWNELIQKMPELPIKPRKVYGKLIKPARRLTG